MRDSHLYIGACLPVLFKMLKKMDKTPGSFHKVISIAGNERVPMAHMIWSEFEFSIFEKKVNMGDYGHYNLEKIKDTLMVRIDDNNIIFGVDGHKNLNEIYRKVFNCPLPTRFSFEKMKEYKADLASKWENNFRYNIPNSFDISFLKGQLSTELREVFLDFKNNCIKNKNSRRFFKLISGLFIGKETSDVDELDAFYIFNKLISGVFVFDFQSLFLKLNSTNIVFQKVEKLSINKLEGNFGEFITKGYDGKILCRGENVNVSNNYTGKLWNRSEVRTVKPRKWPEGYYMWEFCKIGHDFDKFAFFVPSDFDESNKSLTIGNTVYDSFFKYDSFEKLKNFWVNNQQFEFGGLWVNEVNFINPRLGVLPYLAYLFTD